MGLVYKKMIKRSKHKFGLGKKAAIFTIIAIVISALVIASFYALQEVPIDQSVNTNQIRIKTSNYYIKQAQDFAKLASAQVVKGILAKLTHNMIESGTFYPPGSFYFALNTGTRIGIQHSLDTFANYGTDYLNFKNLSIKVKNGNEVSIYQTTPWTVDVEVNLSINADDGYANWSMNNITIKSNFSIIGMTDPTSSIVSYGVAQSKTIKTLNRSAWLVPSTLNNNIDSGVYFNSTNGMSFLDRLANNKTPSKYGIVSMLNLTTAQNGGSDWQKYSNVDFLFYKKIACGGSFGTIHKMNFFKANENLGEVRALVEINETTGMNLNRTVVLDNIPLDVGMPNPYTPGSNYFESIPGCP